MNYYVYILYSKNIDRYYTGYTSDIDKRLEFHKSAESHKFTYRGGSWQEYLLLKCTSKSQALEIEKHIKRMKSKVYIQNLKRYPEMQKKLLDRYAQSSPR